MLIGIVGAPNKGKSTLFSALTLHMVETADYPFTTINPNEGTGYVKTHNLAKDLNLVAKPKHDIISGEYRFIPIRLLDVAGLVPGAHEGRGLGNQFLNDLIPADALIQVVDASGETDLEGKKNSINPIEEVKFLEEELDYWVAGIIKRNWDKVRFKDIKSLFAILSGLKIFENDIEKIANTLNLDKKRIDWEEDEIFSFAKGVRKLSKPIIIAANKCDMPSARKNIENLKKLDYAVIPVSSISELTLKKASQAKLIEYVPGSKNFDVLKELSNEQKNGLNYIQHNVLDVYGSTGAQELLNKTVFDILNMIVVYPVEDEHKYSDSQGNVLPETKLVPQGATPYELAGLIHTDIQEGYKTAFDARKKIMIGGENKLENNSIIKIVFNKK